MKSTKMLGYAGGVGAALALLAFGFPSPAAEARRPNVIIMIADQLRYQSVGFTDPRAITPNIDRLKAEGMLFRNFVSSTPVCSAFRASLLTGKYASSTGYVVNELRMNPNHDSLAHVFTKNGYKSDMIGKWHLWSNKAGGHEGARFNFVPAGPYRMGFDGYWAIYNFGHDNYHYTYWTDGPEEMKGSGFKATFFNDLAIQRIRHHATNKEPFAMVIAHSPPHDPFTQENAPAEYYQKFSQVEFPLPSTWRDAPDPYMDRNTDTNLWLKNWKVKLPGMMRAYYAMTAALDAEVGRLMAVLKEAGIDDDTIVIFTSDHGEMFGAHGRVFKMIFYEESVRVPFIVRWPKKIAPGTTSDACMATPDIMPTVLGLAGLPVPRSVEGLNLAHLALGRPGPEPSFALLQGMGHTFQWKDGYEWRAVRDKRFTYARYLVDGKELLFDNQNDPTQSTNLAANPTHAGQLGDLRKQMADKMADISDPFRLCTWYRDHWTENRVILRGARGEFRRELGPNIPVDVNYTSQ